MAGRTRRRRCRPRWAVRAMASVATARDVGVRSARLRRVARRAAYERRTASAVRLVAALADCVADRRAARLGRMARRTRGRGHRPVRRVTLATLGMSGVGGDTRGLRRVTLRARGRRRPRRCPVRSVAARAGDPARMECRIARRRAVALRATSSGRRRRGGRGVDLVARGAGLRECWWIGGMGSGVARRAARDGGCADGVRRMTARARRVFRGSLLAEDMDPGMTAPALTRDRRRCCLRVTSRSGRGRGRRSRGGPRHMTRGALPMPSGEHRRCRNDGRARGVAP